MWEREDVTWKAREFVGGEEGRHVKRAYGPHQCPVMAPEEDKLPTRLFCLITLLKRSKQL